MSLLLFTTLLAMALMANTDSRRRLKAKDYDYQTLNTSLSNASLGIPSIRCTTCGLLGGITEEDIPLLTSRIKSAAICMTSGEQVLSADQ